MADVQKTVEIIFGATNNLGGGLSSVSNGINSLTSSVSGVTAPLASLGDDLLKTEAAIIALGAAFGVFAVSEAIKFQDAQIDLAKVLSDSDAGVESFTDGVIELSERYGVSAAEILQGTANFKQAGFTSSEAAQLQKDALDLIIAGDLGAAESTDLLVRSLKGFGAEANEASRFTEALNNVSNNFATNLSELAAGMARVSPIASQMGFTFEETAGLITPIIEVFGSGSEAANGLRTGLLSLTDDAKPIQDALAAIDVSQTNLNGEMRSGRDIFNDVALAFKTLDENQKLVITSQLVGRDQASKMIKVFDNLALTQEVTAVAMERTGSVTDEVNLRLGSASKQIDIAVVSFNNLAAEIGRNLLPSLGSISSGSISLIQSFRDVIKSGGLSSFFDELQKDSSQFGQFLDDIARALPEAFNAVNFDNLNTALNNLGASFSNIFDGIDLTDPDDLARAIQFVIDSVSSLTTVVSGIVDAWTPALRAIAQGVQEFNELDDSAKKATGAGLGFSQQFEKIVGIATTVASALDLIGKGLAVIGGTVAVKTVLSLTSGFAGIAPAIAGASTALTALKTLLIGPAGLVAAAGASGFALSNLLDIPEKIDSIFDSGSLGSAIFDLLHSGDDENITGALNAIGAKANDTAAIFKDADAKKNELLDQKSTNNLLDELSGLNTEIDDLAGAFTASDEEILKWSRGNKEAEQATKDLADAQRVSTISTEELSKELSGIPSTKEIILDDGNSIKTATDDLLTFNDALQSLDTGISSTNTLISDIIGTGDVDKPFGGLSLSAQRQLDRAELLREKELRLQEELIEAQTELTQAKTKAFENGSATIEINTDGLEPALELIFTEIIQKTQLKASSDGLGFLLGAA